MSALGALVAAAWSRAGGWIAAAGAALAMLLAAYLTGRRDGQAASRMQTLERAARAREVRDEVDRAVDRSGDADDELRRDWRRGM
ncbi:hypothetical protein GXW78_26550 [Roseomonas terrae]|uniref:ABC transporter permease n=1 Tax=Neoroseomonas terrae TaxID=424799 RepID=A0ABS5EQD8_9PROT|nr:hypothetical protein [Neoroseomonas terrae]MBR0653241.1 hypothetical protein [Neoroseomonas terrae]